MARVSLTALSVEVEGPGVQYRKLSLGAELALTLLDMEAVEGEGDPEGLRISERL